MEPMLANTSVSITELKKNPSSLIEKSEGEPIVILNHNRPTAYLVPAKKYKEMIEKINNLGKIKSTETWQQFVESTYGAFSDNKLKRASQDDFELREVLK